MRNLWIDYLQQITYPVLSAAANDDLRIEMPVYKGKSNFQYLEAIGRIVCGISPWLSLPEDPSSEGKLRERFRVLTAKAIENLVSPTKSVYVDFSIGSQCLVDAAYLSQGFLRVPKLWELLPDNVKANVIFEVKKTQRIDPPKNNWLLFASIIEAFLLEFNGTCNKKRLYYGVKKFVNRYYIDDGFYGDGKRLSIDYYNSFVIHPMLTDIINTMCKHGLKKSYAFKNKHIPRYQRFVQLQERMISPEGAYPVFGRTLICRFGVFHALSQAAYLELLPNDLKPSQVRSALSAVLNKHMACSMNFDSKGFMAVGFNGQQDFMAEDYVSSGSAYHCATIFLPLGLEENHPFWAAPDCDWTSVKAYSGQEFNADKAFHEINKTIERLMPIKYKLLSGWRKTKRIFTPN